MQRCKMMQHAPKLRWPSVYNPGDSIVWQFQCQLDTSQPYFETWPNVKQIGAAGGSSAVVDVLNAYLHQGMHTFNTLTW
jgi:hypothetical protein